MRPFLYQRAGNLAEAVRQPETRAAPIPPTMAAAQFLAGGTTLIDLMKLDVMRPAWWSTSTASTDGSGMRIERRQRRAPASGPS